MEASTSIPACCCGTKDCVALAKNSSLLEGLERDVHKAAQLGQALLVRHEAYVADSERERDQMTATIQQLEKDKLDLEERNAQTIKANRDLLDQLEQLNSAVEESDAQVKALTATLHSTEEELGRLSALASRTERLERELLELERDQAQIQGDLEAKTIDERTAIQRWKRAEATVVDLQDQLDRIEREAREERERHAEITARMEKRVAVERELGRAAGRLKSAQETGGPGVVSHFVKDILLDNANLQSGIIELREMLQNSNEEVELLREQLRAHQPASPLQGNATPTLQRELSDSPVVNQELHIHHHYHQAPTPVQRRMKKKRGSIASAHYSSVPPSPSTPAAILAQTSVTVPQNRHNRNRWSDATTLAPASLPGSPMHSRRPSSFYDRAFSDAYDSSRPTSPSESVEPGSPMFVPVKSQDIAVTTKELPQNERRPSRKLMPPPPAPLRNTSAPIPLMTKSTPATAVISTISPQDSDMFTLSPSLHSTIPEENEETSTTASLTSPVLSPDLDSDAFSPMEPRSSLRRAASHESLISISGMDIHTLQSRPSQLLMSTNPRFSSPSSGTSTQPVVSNWTATATVSSRKHLDSSTLNRSLLYGTQVNQKRGVKPQKSDAGLGKKVGGWVFGKWGATPSQSSPDPKPHFSTNKTPTATTKGNSAPSTIQRPSAIPIRLRPSGVNQSGPIWGFFDTIPATPTQLTPSNLDQEALSQALQDH